MARKRKRTNVHAPAAPTSLVEAGPVENGKESLPPPSPGTLSPPAVSAVETRRHGLGVLRITSVAGLPYVQPLIAEFARRTNNHEKARQAMEWLSENVGYQTTGLFVGVGPRARPEAFALCYVVQFPGSEPIAQIGYGYSLPKTNWLSPIVEQCCRWAESLGLTSIRFFSARPTKAWERALGFSPSQILYEKQINPPMNGVANV